MTEATMGRKLGWALQGMALWHAVLLLPVSLLLVILITAPGGDESGEGNGMAVLASLVLAAGAIVAAVILAGIGWALLGRQFLRPRWSLIIVPGLIGTITVAPASFIGWPTAEVVGAFVAYWLVSRRLKHEAAKL